MFRVASDFVQDPFYLVICDDVRCATMFQHPLSSDTTANQEAPAIQAAQKDGWLMSFGWHLCPGHYKQLKERAVPPIKSRIVVPRLGIAQ